MREVILNDYLPNCLAIGIRLEEFWELNITKLQPFIKAEQIKLERKNYEMWLQGHYFFDAISLALANGFNRNGGQKYHEKPYDLKGAHDDKDNRLANEEILKQKIMAMANSMKEKNNG